MSDERKQRTGTETPPTMSDLSIELSGLVELILLQTKVDGSQRIRLLYQVIMLIY